MLTVCTLIWEPNRHSQSFSRIYDESWIEKLYRGFARNLTVPWRFVLFTDREREIGWPVEQIVEPDLGANGYSDCIRPYRLGVPMILVGLDTIVTGNIDHLAEYCMTAKTIALPLDPYNPCQVCNGVALVPAGQEYIARDHRGENDMEWLRKQPHKVIDALFPGQVVSYKGSIKRTGIDGVKVAYFHGQEKPNELQHLSWVREHWK